MVAYGFDLGYRGPITPGPHKNLLSALFHHKGITRLARSMFYLSRSCMFLLLARWRKILLFASSWIFLLVRSGESVNDGIDKLEYSVQYQSFDDAVDLVRMPSVVSGFSFAGYALGTFGGRSFSFYIYSFADALAWDLVFFCVRDYSRSTLLRYFFVASPCRANFVALTCWVYWCSHRPW